MVKIISVNKTINNYAVYPEITYRVYYSSGKDKTYYNSCPQSVSNFMAAHNVRIDDTNKFYIVEYYN